MTQLELSFRNETGRVFAMQSVEEVVPKTRVSKDEKLKQAAVETRKMTSWLVPKVTKQLEWDDDPDLPEMEEKEEIEKRELAKIHQETLIHCYNFHRI